MPHVQQELLRQAAQLRRSGRVDEAIAAYKRLLAIEPDLPDSWYNLAWLQRQVRAFDPWPGAYFEGRGERIRVLAADINARPGAAQPGTVLDDKLTIACGEGALRPLRLQRPGRSPFDTAAFLRGFALPSGTVLPCPATS